MELSHASAGIAPDREQHALPFMIARGVGVGLAEISCGDGTVNRSNDLRESDIGCLPSEHVAATDTPLRTNEAGTFEGEKELLEAWLGKYGSFGDLAQRGGRGFGVERER